MILTINTDGSKYRLGVEEVISTITNCMGEKERVKVKKYGSK